MPDNNSSSPVRFSVICRPDLPPPVALGVWVLEDARRRTLCYLRRIDQATVDYRPSPSANTIGTLLYHLSAAEMDWLYEDIVLAPPPASVEALLPHPYHDEDGDDKNRRLMPVVGASPDDHRARLEAVQGVLLDALSSMDEVAYRQPREGPSGIFSAEWIVYHLAQHEAHHRGQIAILRRAAELAGYDR